MGALKFVTLLVGAFGITVIATSVPPLASRGLSRRVEPYLHGLRGKPSRLLVRRSTAESSMFAKWLAGVGLTSRPRLRERLEAAGRPLDEVGFAVEQVVWGGVTAALILVPTIIGVVLGTLSPSPAFLVVTAIAGVTGALGRDWHLSKEIAQRRSALMNDFPTAIDHMTLALLAGESIGGAFSRVASSSAGPVAEEFGRVATDVRGGSSVIDALEAFGSRVPDPAIARFVDSLCTAVERGTSLSDVLRAQADDVREARRRYLLELGGRREIVMLIPVVFLIMPVVVVFALYPGLVSLDLLVP